MESTLQNINFIKFSELYNWSVSHLLGQDFEYNKKFPLVKIGKFLTKNNNVVNLDNDTIYKRVTVSGNNGGVRLRNTEIGKNIGTKRQFIVKSGQFILSKIDARNGAMGLIPEDLEGAIVTNDFPTYNVDTTAILPQFLLLITTTKKFIEFAQTCSSGTTNRQRIDLKKFLDVQIPLPPLNDADAIRQGLETDITQEKLIEEYNQKLKTAELAKKEAVNKEIEIENYLYKQLGIIRNVAIEEKSGLTFVKFKDLNDRWDIYKPSILNDAKYELIPFKNLILKISTGTTPPSARKDYFNGSVNFYTPTDIGKEIYLYNSTRTLTQKAIDDKKARVFYKNTLLFVGIGTIGKVGIVKNEIATSNQQITGIVVDEQKVNLEFLFFYINIFRSEITKEQTKTTIPILNQKGIEQIKIPLPPLNIQKSIAKQLISMSKAMEDQYNLSEDMNFKAILDFENIIFNSDNI
ncbi:restriction endonuclease subunit S [Mesoflavibacter sp. CH_XMU1404-2]|uniref:restriction endonuclease subunit S n=1 Tax=Mesoflavibacter sp. CH_XMU1404-2 TaxID=3107766 RepID=UPI0030096893|tara:strand:- start:1730 stop:3118 length:1389 start_codon:yes stop_codon:yes gene_type:complete